MCEGWWSAGRFGAGFMLGDRIKEGARLFLKDSAPMCSQSSSSVSERSGWLLSRGEGLLSWYAESLRGIMSLPVAARRPAGLVRYAEWAAKVDLMLDSLEKEERGSRPRLCSPRNSGSFGALTCKSIMFRPGNSSVVDDSRLLEVSDMRSELPFDPRYEPRFDSDGESSFEDDRLRP